MRKQKDIMGNDSQWMPMHGVRALLVDDLKTNLVIAESMLSSFNIHVDMCTNGTDAMHLVNSNIYDIVFMDMILPEIDGLEVTRRIRAIGGTYFQRLPVILMTATLTTSVVERLLKSGINDFVIKPLSKEYVIKVLKKWLPGIISENKHNAFMQVLTPEFNIKGVNTLAGIVTSGGSNENYMKTLEVFYDDGNSKKSELNEYIASNDIEAYSIQIHALKSALAAIGAAALSKNAELLEKACISNDISYLKENTAQFISELDNILVEIGTVIGKSPAVDAVGMDDLVMSGEKSGFVTNENIYHNLPDEESNVLIVQMERLKCALKQYDIEEADDALKRVSQYSSNAYISSMNTRISRSILLFEYSEAMALIDELEVRLNGTGS